MATHDYVIANGTGAAVRSDLNDALAAIVSNNSGSSEPATKYAYQWWADTTANVLKIRNSANNAWITLRELDGTLLMEDGSNSAPGLSFASDTNTGFFSGGADKIGFATGGVERLEIGSSEVVFNDPSNDVDFRVESNGQAHMLFVDAGNDRFGIRTSSPDAALAVNGGSDNTIGTFTSTDAGAFISFSDPTGEGIIGQSGAELRISVDPGASVANSAIVFQADGNDEKARIDSSGRLLLGTSTSPSGGDGHAQNALLLVQGRVGVDADSGRINLQRGSGASSGSSLGSISFTDSSNNSYARIEAFGDAATGTDDYPGRITFSTTSDGASSPTERMRISNTGNVKLTGGEALFWDDAGDRYIACIGDSTSNINLHGRANVIFKTGGSSYDGGSERARLDSSGRLLVGTSSSRSTGYGDNAQLQVEGTSYPNAAIAVTLNSNNADGPSLNLSKSRGTSVGSNTIIQNGDALGVIAFGGADGNDAQTNGARIQAQVDGTPGSNDMPTRLTFSTCGDGTNSPTERARITQKGAFKAAGNFGIVDANGPNHEFNYQDGSNHVVRLDAASTSYAQAGGGIFHINCRTAHSSGWTFGGWYSGNVSDREFNFRGDGNGYADGSWNGGGADYAEFFEWSDSNAKAEDRRGISVVLDGDKIREAVAGEEPIGVISGNPSVVGDADIDRWKGKYLRDDYGTYIEEDFETKDDDGNTVVQQRRKLNPDYDPDTEYVSRENRPEWDTVGLMGKLRIRKGQVTGTRWIKMRDVSDTVEEWLVR